MTSKLSEIPPACSTDDLFGLEEPWWVVRTKSRQEKTLAWSLKKVGINYYLPLVGRPQKNKKRLRLSIIPLFPGYLFFRGTDQDRFETLKTGRVAQVIPVVDQTTLNDELQAIFSVTTIEKNLELCDFVKKGQKVKVINGPFAHTEGIIQGTKSKTRLILMVQAIRQAVRIEIDINQVQLL